MEGWSIHKATERETGRGKQKEAQWDRQRYTAIRTLVFYPSLIGKPSTVNSALKLDIDPLPPLPLLSLSPYMSLSSFGTPHFPFCWFRLHLVLLSIPLYLCPSWDSCHLRTLDSITCILPYEDRYKDEIWEWRKWWLHVQNGTFWDFNEPLHCGKLPSWPWQKHCLLSFIKELKTKI